jgi:hypothetical protein
MRRPTPQVRSTLRGSATVSRALRPNRKEDRPTMDGSKDQPRMTAGLDLADKYSYLCLIDQESGEVVQEGRLLSTPEALRRRFASEHLQGASTKQRAPGHIPRRCWRPSDPSWSRSARSPSASANTSASCRPSPRSTNHKKPSSWARWRESERSRRLGSC